MSVIRRRLRIAVAAWLLFQVVSLSALVPRDCCDAHRISTERCHESAESAYCPMRSQGRNCPMHQPAPVQDGHADHADPVASEHAAHAAAVPATHESHDDSRARCTIGGSCSAPATALAVILSSHGVVPPGVPVPANLDSAVAPAVPDEHLISRLAAPDSPPPRA
jgi:hypothetical protein